MNKIEFADQLNKMSVEEIVKNYKARELSNFYFMYTETVLMNKTKKQMAEALKRYIRSVNRGKAFKDYA